MSSSGSVGRAGRRRGLTARRPHETRRLRRSHPFCRRCSRSSVGGRRLWLRAESLLLGRFSLVCISLPGRRVAALCDGDTEPKRRVGCREQALRWDGRRWTKVVPRGESQALYDIDLHADKVLTVGQDWSRWNTHGAIVEWNGKRWHTSYYGRRSVSNPRDSRRATARQSKGSRALPSPVAARLGLSDGETRGATLTASSSAAAARDRRIEERELEAGGLNFGLRSASRLEALRSDQEGWTRLATERHCETDLLSWPQTRALYLRGIARWCPLL